MSIKDKYRVISIKPETVKEWFLKKHYAKAVPSISFCFGLYEGSYLKAVCSWGNGAVNLAGSIVEKHKDLKHFELNRLVADNLERNALSFFVAECMRMMPKPTILVSYADGNQNHHGYIYQATNWHYVGMTAPEKKYYNTRTGKRLHSHTVVDIYGSRSAENLPEYIKIVDEEKGKYRYVFFNGNKRFKADCIKNSRYEIQQYPKGQNKRYDDYYNPSRQAILF